LRRAAPEVFFLHLDGSPELIGERLAGREGHFMPPALLRSQFETLEPLDPDEAGAAVPIDGTPDEVMELAVAAVPR
jgi:gluconokinase